MMEKLVNAVSGCALQALQDVNQGERPAVAIPKRGKQNVYMVGHDDHRMQMHARCGAGAPARELPQATFPQAVFKDKIASSRRQHQWSAGAKGDKQICVGLLQMWKASAVLVLGKP
jgi:hypothetical protein